MVLPLSRQFAVQEDVEIHLIHDGLSQACLGVITVPDPKVAVQIIKTMGRLVPSLSLEVRSRYNRHNKDLEKAGATIVVDEDALMGEMLSRRITDCMADPVSMGGVILVVAFKLIDVLHIKEILKSRRSETMVLAATFFGTLFFEIEFAIYTGVLLSLAIYLTRMSHPRIQSIVPFSNGNRRRMSREVMQFLRTG